MNRPMWFDYPAADQEKLADYYVSVFGWEKKKWKGPELYYYFISGAENQPGLDGGIAPKGEFETQLNYIEVDDIDAYTQKVTENGGTVVFQKTFMEEEGYTIWCKDPEGNLFGMMQKIRKLEPVPDEKVVDVRENNRAYHFEIPANDTVKLAEFYVKVFGWKQQMWENQTDYILMETGGDSEPGMSGAITKRGDVSGTVNTIIVYDLDKYLEKVTKSGGKIITPKYKIEKIGLHAYCEDPEGNRFGIMQPDMNM